MNTDNIILRGTDNPPLVNKDDLLSIAEIDGNFINIYNDFISLSNAEDSTLTFDVDRTYLVGEYSTYDGRMWVAIEVSTGVTPIVGSAEWLDVFPSVLAHEKNKDTILDEGGENETTVAEIRTFIDAGLTSTTNLSLTTKTGTSFKIESSTGTDVTIPQATNVDAGLLNSNDKVKLDNTSGTNTGDQTLVSLSGEDVTNKVVDFTTINNTLYPTTQAVDTYLTAQIPDLVETFLDSNVELNTNKATTFVTVNDVLYPSVKAVNDQLTNKVDKVAGSRLITSAEGTKLDNTSGTNTGDQNLSTLLVKTNNLSDLTNTTTARTNLSLGSLATQSGTFSGTSSGTNTGDQIISDATITTTDITTNNFTTSKHGFVPKGTNVGNFLKDDGTWAVAGGGLTNFAEATATTSPNNTINANSLTVVASSTNADFVIKPKGTGAILASVPNSTATAPNIGGNKRGIYALDFQRFGTLGAQTEVASGNYAAIVGGSRNTASGELSAVLNGYRNTSSGGYSAVLNGDQNTSSGAYSVVLNGQVNTASNSYATVINGYGNTASTYSLSGGLSCTASTKAFSYGESNTASGGWSVALNGFNTASSDYSNARGLNSSTFTTWGKSVLGGGGATVGSSQKGTLVQTTRTTDAVAKEIAFQGGGVDVRAQMQLQDNSLFRVKGSIAGKQSGSTNVAVFDFDYVIVRGVGAGTTVFAGTPNVNVVTNIPAWGTPTITVFNGYASIKVIGATATNIQWTATLESTEVIYA